MTIAVCFARTAERDILNESIWWRTNRPANPELFDEDLARAVALLRTFPDAGERARTRRYKRARVIVLTETGHLLVYRRETKTRVRVLALFGSKKTETRP